MRVAITGATGLLGRYLVKELTDASLCLLGRSEERLVSTFGDAPGRILSATDYSIEDLTCVLQGVDAVVHLCTVRYCEEFESLFDYVDNIRISENVFRTCVALNIPNVIFSSTRSVYSDVINRVPFKENEPLSPRNLYAISKVAAEQIGLRLPLSIKCLRFAQLVALGERKGFMLRTFMDRAQRGEPLMVFGKGQGKREYIYARDAARAIIVALDQSANRGVFNVGSGVETSHRQLAEAVIQVFGNGQSEVMFDDSRTEDTSKWLMDSTKFRNTFGWSPNYTLEDGLQEIKRDL